MRPFLALALLTITLLTGAACSSSPGGPAGCDKPRHDPLDPRFVTHILPGATPPPYLTDPPTSGEHQPVNILAYEGTVTAPIPKPIQVALLESSLVVVQYRAPLTADDLAPLKDNGLVTLAPNPELPAPVVATAWVWRLQCAGPPAAALPALRTFVTAHAGKGPQPPPPRPS